MLAGVTCDVVYLQMFNAYNVCDIIYILFTKYVLAQI